MNDGALVSTAILEPAGALGVVAPDSLDFEASLVAELRAFGAVAALVGQRIHADVTPQTGAYPCIVYECDEAETLQTLAGPSERATTEVLVHCLGPTRGEARAIAAAVKTCMEAVRGRELGGAGGCPTAYIEVKDGKARNYRTNDGRDKAIRAQEVELIVRHRTSW